MIRDGSQVTIHYTLTIDDEVIDSSAGGEPLVYVQGEGQIIPGLERQLAGLAVGDRREVTVAPDEGYGVEDPDAYHVVPREMFRDTDALAVGDGVEGRIDDQPFRAVVAEVSTESVTLNLNHPLAGKTLLFAIEVVAVG